MPTRRSAKAGGIDLDANAALKQATEAARRAGVPKDIVARNIKRASDKDAAALEETVVEVYGPGGAAFVLECLTDCRQRAASEIWTVVKKHNGKVLATSSVGRGTCSTRACIEVLPANACRWRLPRGTPRRCVLASPFCALLTSSFRACRVSSR